MRRSVAPFFCFFPRYSPAGIPTTVPGKPPLPGLNSASSPRVADLTGGGILDVVMGAGGREWSPSEVGIIALNGADGRLLWSAPARNQVVGSALFPDISGDGTPEVVIGGRSAELRALDGKAGRTIWEFFKTTEKHGARKAGWFNFFNG